MTLQSDTVSMELLRTLDEKHMASSIAFEAAHTAAMFVVDGTSLSTVDGELDVPRVTEMVVSALRRVPEFDKRLMASPLGVTTPAWVPADGFEISRNVVFTPTDLEMVPANLVRLAGMDRPPLALDQPLWDVTVTRLTGGDAEGDVAIGVRMHHVVGDAKWAFETMTLITDPTPDAGTPTSAVGPTRSPRSSLVIPVHAAGSWIRQQPSVRAAWKEYWRKPFIKRARRMGGRNIRPLQEWLIRRRHLREVHLPPTTTTYFTVDASKAARVAAKLRGSLNDLLVSASMRAVDDDDRGLDVLVAVSRRKRGDRQVRNHVQMIRVHGAPDLPVEQLVPSIRAQVAAFARNGQTEEQPLGRSIGYTTIVPWADHVRYFSGIEVKALTIVPATDRRDELSVFASTYGGVMTVTVCGRAELDIEAAATRLRSALEPHAEGGTVA
jgi:diacylglycerol O-acyltransferase